MSRKLSLPLILLVAALLSLSAGLAVYGAQIITTQNASEPETAAPQAALAGPEFAAAPQAVPAAPKAALAEPEFAVPHWVMLNPSLDLQSETTTPIEPTPEPAPRVQAMVGETVTRTIGESTLSVSVESGAPEGILVIEPENLPTNVAITFSPPTGDIPSGEDFAIGSVVDIQVENAPSAGLEICLPVPANLRESVGGRALVLLHYDGTAWEVVPNSRRDGGEVCAPGLTNFSLYAVGYDTTQPAEPTPPPQIDPPVVTMTRLADGIYHYTQFFGGFYTGSLVVIDDGKVLITDPSNNPRAELMKAEIAKVTDNPVSHIVVTQEHFDHAGGTGVFPDATIFCHINCEAHFALDVLGDVPEVDFTYETEMDLTIGSKLIELHYLGPTDGDASTVLYLPSEGIVLTNDLYEPQALTHRRWVDDKNFTGVRQALNTIAEWPLAYAINAHSPGNSRDALYENQDYYNDLFYAVMAAFQEAANTGDVGQIFAVLLTLPQTLQLEQYQDWGNYDSSFPRHVERMLQSIGHGD